MRTLSIKDCEEKIKALKIRYSIFNEEITKEARSSNDRVQDGMIATQYEAEIEAFENIIAYLKGELTEEDFMF